MSIVMHMRAYFEEIVHRLGSLFLHQPQELMIDESVTSVCYFELRLQFTRELCCASS